MIAYQLKIILCVGLFAISFGCQDESNSADPPPLDLSNRGDMSDAAVRGQRDTGPTFIDAFISGDARMNEGDSNLGECVPGASRCPQEGGAVEEVCRPGGMWALNPCADDFICVGGGCVPDPLGCVPGERTCLGTNTPAICDNDSWQAQDECPEGTGCLDGECLSQACAFAARRASYQGCDYLAVDLPNSAFDMRDENGDGRPDGTTENSPVGLVIANTSTAEPVTVNILAPDGQPSPLIASQLIQIPAIPEIQGMYQPQTVTSEIRDSDGLVVQPVIAQGANLIIPAGGVGTFLLPRRMGPLASSSLRRDAYRVRTDFPVVVYQFSPYCCNYSFSNDASLLLPTTALGQRYRFMGVPFHSTNPFTNEGAPGMITVVSPSDRNRVTVTLPPGANVELDGDGQISVQGGQAEARMNAQDVLILTGSNQPQPSDLTGAVVTSTKPVSVFSSHVCSYYPEALGACDHLQEQLFPVSTWGRRFQLVPVAERNRNWFTEVTYWKLVADESPTRFTLSVPFNQLNASEPGFSMVTYCGRRLDGDSVITLGPGETCEFGTKRAVAIESDQPAMVMGIIAGQQATGLFSFGSHAGDPAIFLVPPDEQYRQEYTFLTPDTYYTDYVTIISPPNNQITLDGNPVNLDSAVQITGSLMQYTHLEVTDGPHRIEGRAPFGIVVYAYDDFVSYAFTGGLNLQKR